jgi:hypothetical protein
MKVGPKTMLGWYFSDVSETLRYGDGRKIKVGETHTVECEPVLCHQGLHASKTILDALEYAPGNILFRVKLSGMVVHDTNKSVATSRKYLSRIDAENILRQFARQCALDVVHLWNCPAVVLQYLQTGKEELRTAAGASARDAAQVAAWAASWSAVLDADQVAARVVARAAAQDAAWASARAASSARAAAQAASRKQQSRLLEKMVRAAL